MALPPQNSFITKLHSDTFEEDNPETATAALSVSYNGIQWWQTK